MTNTTLYGNTCTGIGGAIYQSYNGSASFNVYNSTIFQNTSATGGAFYAIIQPKFYSSIVAGNTASSGVSPDFYIQSSVWATNSLIGTTNGGFTVASPTITNAAPNMPNASGNYCGNTAVPQAPGLLPLAWNGGAVPTCALVPGSVAIDHGLNPLGLAWDERGVLYARVQDGQPDMGAFENYTKGSVFTLR